MLDGRCAAGDERPRDQPGTIDLRGMGAFGVRCVVVVLECVEGGVERPERVAQKAVVCFGPRRCGAGPDAVDARVVRDRNRVARDIVGPIAVRQRRGARAQADEERNGNTRTAHP